MQHHQTLALDEWDRTFSRSVSAQEQIGYITTVGPGAAVFSERIRHGEYERHFTGPTQAVDRFVFSCGSPQIPLTKIGGSPYRPASAKWPLDRNGLPMQFVAQFAFQDSLDIVGKLPGNLLLLFVRASKLQYGCSPIVLTDDANSVIAEWQSVAIDDLVRPENVPHMFDVPSWTGIRFRTVDYLQVDCISESLAKAGCLSTDLSMPVLTSILRNLARSRGVKIGGLPPSIGKIPLSANRFLCSISTLGCSFDLEYPLADRRDPFSLTECVDSSNYFDICDGFILNLFLEPDSSIEWTIEIA